MTAVIKGFKKDPKYEFWWLRVFGITWLVYAGFYLTRASFAVAKIGIGEDPSIILTSEQMRIIDGIYLAAYAPVGGTIPGFFKDSWGWGGVFTFLAGSVLIAGMLIIPRWNALRNTIKSQDKK